MAKKDKRITADQAIPIRVTNAKIVSREKKKDSLERADSGSQTKKGVDQDFSGLEDLLGKHDETPDITTLVKRNSRRRFIVRIILVLLGLFALSFAGFYFFTHSGSKFGKNIGLTIDAPSAVSSGDVVTISVRYQNNEQIDLKDVVLTMQFPEGFSFQSSIPSSSGINSWTIGKLKARAGGVIEMKGQMVGDVGSAKSFSGKLTYIPVNFNYPFDQEVTQTITIGSSALSLSVDAPLRLVPDKEFTAKIHYTNSSEDSIDNVQVVMTAPDGFTIKKSKPDQEKLTWKLGSLDAKQGGDISVTGSLSGKVGDQKQFIVKIGFQDTTGGFVSQTEKTFLVLMIKAGLTLDVKSKTVTDTYAQWGESIAYTVTYTNDGDIAIDKASLALQLNDETSGGKDATIIDWDAITTLDQAIIQDKSVVWDPTTVKALASLKPNDTGTFTVSIPLVKKPTLANDADEQFHILAQLVASQSSQDSAKETITTKSDVTETKIATTVRLTSQARYYSDSLQKIGSGPLPPVVGSTTTYSIQWTIANVSNDVTNVVVTATLPVDVSWVGETTISAGDPISFNPQTREVKWTVNRIPSGAGDLFPQLVAKFSISITPQESQIGKFVMLLNETKLKATDVYVNIERTDTQTLLTTDLKDDPEGRGKGLVSPS